MKTSVKAKIMSALVTCSIIMTSPVGLLKAAADEKAPYVSEVFIAYGKTADDAKKWFTDNGWEPVEGNFNAEKHSTFYGEVAAVMGIHRTAKAEEAVTDMAVMNMAGGYSFEDYTVLVQEKKTEIDEFVNSFLPVINEYRDNYNGKGGADGKARAQLAHELLNKFYDGEVDGEYAVNDTGKPLGDLLLNQTRQELGDEAYNAMDKNEKAEHADLQQILLESTGPAVLVVEQALAVATDTAEDSWIDRLTELSGVDLADVAEAYIPDAAGQNLAASAAESLIQSRFGDAAKKLAASYDTIQQELIWYETYMDKNNLHQQENETDDAYSARLDAHFAALKEQDEEQYTDILNEFTQDAATYSLLYSVGYESDWGDTLGDFFHPEDGVNYGDDADNFLPGGEQSSKNPQPQQHHRMRSFISTPRILAMRVNISTSGRREPFSHRNTVVSVTPSASASSFRDKPRSSRNFAMRLPMIPLPELRDSHRSSVILDTGKRRWSSAFRSFFSVIGLSRKVLAFVS